MWGWRGFSSVEPDQSRATRLRLVAAKLNLYKLVRWWLNSSLDGGISFFVSKLRNSILCIFTFFFCYLSADGFISICKQSFVLPEVLRRKRPGFLGQEV